MSAVEERERSQYRRDMLPSILGYAVVLALVLSLVGDDVETSGEWALLVLPVVPALWGVRAVVRHLRRVDEYQRLLQLEAMAAGFGVAMVTSLTLGFVGIGGFATPAAGWVVYGAGMLTWALVALVQGRRGWHQRRLRAADRGAVLPRRGRGAVTAAGSRMGG